MTADKLYDIQELAFDAHVDFSRVRWAMSPKNLTRVRQLKDSTGQMFLTPSLASGAPATLLRCGYTVTNHLPDGVILFFDPAQVAIGIDDRASVTISDLTDAEYDEVGLRVTATHDIASLNASAVVKLSGKTT